MAAMTMSLTPAARRSSSSLSLISKPRPSSTMRRTMVSSDAPSAVIAKISVYSMADAGPDHARSVAPRSAPHAARKMVFTRSAFPGRLAPIPPSRTADVLPPVRVEIIEPALPVPGDDESESLHPRDVGGGDRKRQDVALLPVEREGLVEVHPLAPLGPPLVEVAVGLEDAADAVGGDYRRGCSRGGARLALRRPGIRTPEEDQSGDRQDCADGQDREQRSLHRQHPSSGRRVHSGQLASLGPRLTGTWAVVSFPCRARVSRRDRACRRVWRCRVRKRLP